jgi:purine-binding chemotaxis protein CheW
MAAIERQSGRPSAIRPREFLTFRLGEEAYAIDILKVQEIRGYETPTRIANAPDFVKGVVNLRGVIVPIIDLRLKLRLGPARYDALTVVIVLNLGTRVVGAVVDSVSDVIALSDEQVQPAPDVGAAIDAGCIAGLATLQDRMLILVEIERLMAIAELAPAEQGA